MTKLSVVKELLRPRMGRYVPMESRALLGHDYQFTFEGVSARLVPVQDRSGQAPVRNYMKERFYREAPIPTVLNLSNEHSPAIQQHVEKELDLFCNSGTSLFMTASDDDDNVVGCGLTITWTRDPSYEILDVPQPLWHNAAAELAQEECPEEPQVFWRDLQFQHFYNVSQKAMKKHGKELTYYMACFIVNNNVRGSGFTGALVPEMIRHLNLRGVGGMLVTQSNFPGFDQFVYKHIPDSELLDEMKYSDETLSISGRKLFEPLAPLGHMRFFGGCTK